MELRYMNKCDVIIPVYKAPEWVKLCVYALFANTDKKIINKVFLINDCNDPLTANCLKNLQIKYGKKIVIKHNKKNLGFIKTTNSGIKLSTADYVLLLNSDCLLAKNGIQKLINHIQKNPKIGLICPLASNAANLTLEVPEGFNYSQVDQILEKNFLGRNFDACTIVGNCLMISRDCIKKTGYLDESYGTGYGEETDYQFKAMENGFEAKVAIDTFVFHKAEASFGTSKDKQLRLQKNRELFFSRWGEQYASLMKKYEKNDPIKYIKSNLPEKTWHPDLNTLFYIDGVIQNAGGVHVVVDIVNYLSIHGEAINITYNLHYPYQENVLFTPIPSNHLANLKTKQIVSTIWKTAYAARKIADDKEAELVSFVQGYESYFENGSIYGGVELSYKLADRIFTISDYLKKQLKEVFDVNATVISNGINYDITASSDIKPSPTIITIILRDNIMKGDWILLDIIRRLDNLKQKLKVNLVTINPYIMTPSLKNVELNILNGPQNRNTIYRLLKESTFYIDASLSEGFGLTALEAMSAGCIPIVSDSQGINQYISTDQNGVIIKDFNNADSYVQAIVKLLADKPSVAQLSQKGHETAKLYDFDDQIKTYINFFHDIRPYKTNDITLSKTEQEIIDFMTGSHAKHKHKITTFEIIKKITPKPIKIQIVKIIDKLYKYINY